MHTVHSHLALWKHKIGTAIVRRVTLSQATYCVPVPPPPWSGDTSPSVQHIGRGVPLTRAEFERAMLADPNSPPDARLLKLAIIGSPNSGKSTLVNKLMNWKLSSVSSKVHTTRSRITTIMTEGNTQIVIMDTPGMVSQKQARKHRLESSMLTDPYSSFHEADLVLVVVDAANKWTGSELDQCVIRALAEHPDKEAVLVLNKVDIVRDKSRLLEMARTLSGNCVGGRQLGTPLVGPAAYKVRGRRSIRDIVDEYDERMKQKQELSISSSSPEKEVDSSEADSSANIMTIPDEQPSYPISTAVTQLKSGVWPGFASLFMLSGGTGDGVGELRRYLMSAASPGQWLYPSRVVVARSPSDLVVDIIREQLLELLPSEVPYEIGIQVGFWDAESDPGLLRVAVFLDCPRPRYHHLVLGRAGETIKLIALNAKQQLMNLFRTDMTLKIVARVVRNNQNSAAD